MLRSPYQIMLDFYWAYVCHEVFSTISLKNRPSSDWTRSQITTLTMEKKNNTAEHQKTRGFFDKTVVLVCLGYSPRQLIHSLWLTLTRTRPFCAIHPELPTKDRGDVMVCSDWISDLASWPIMGRHSLSGNWTDMLRGLKMKPERISHIGACIYLQEVQENWHVSGMRRLTGQRGLWRRRL